jgi:hypothetical protein
MALVATVHRRGEGSPPVSGARIEARLVWREGLEEGDGSPPTLPTTRLWESEQTPGRYEGTVEAPRTRGYYAASALIRVQGEPDVVLEELILVDSPLAGEVAGEGESEVGDDTGRL